MDFEVQRQKMVERQLIPRGIKDPAVIKAFGKVERHRFVPQDELHLSYDDHPLPIGHGQTISQPYMVAAMTQLLRLACTEKVLEIGTGSGYQTAILAELAKEVYTIERIADLSEKAKLVLDGCGYGNVHLKIGDGTLGWSECGPYDAIIVTAGAPDIQELLIGQLADRGRMVIPVGGAYSQVLTLLEKREGELSEHKFGGCVFVPLIGEKGWSS